jgi:hypothetical protein
LQQLQNRQTTTKLDPAPSSVGDMRKSLPPLMAVPTMKNAMQLDLRLFEDNRKKRTTTMDTNGL